MRPNYINNSSDGSNSSEANCDAPQQIEEEIEFLKSVEYSEPEKDEEGCKHQTSYIETLIHLFKGNMGPGCYAMGDAFKNGGLLISPILTVVLGFICVHAQHILIIYADKMKNKYNLKMRPDYAKTVELCFDSGPEQCKRWSAYFKAVCNIFICVTQLGFCCVYIVFIAEHLKQVLDYCGLHYDLNTLMIVSLIPITLTSLITNLKFLTPCSFIASFCMLFGIGITFYFSVQDLPALSERDYTTSIHKLPLFFGTTLFAFEGITLVLPLQNSMKNSKKFSTWNGVLNIGMIVVTFIFVSFGFIGYLKYGEDVQGSLSLNLPSDSLFAQMVKVATALSVLLGYPLQFFVAVQILCPLAIKKFKVDENHQHKFELIFRGFLVLITYIFVKWVPKLSLLLSLIGAFCSTALALVFPPIIQCILNTDKKNKNYYYILIKNTGILIVAMLGFVTGTYESLKAIIMEDTALEQ